jgi:hypothetical protein
MKKLILGGLVLACLFTSAFAMKPAPLAVLLGPVIIETKQRAEGHQFRGVDVAMNDYLIGQSFLKGYNPHAERVEDEETVGFKILLSNVPQVDCKSLSNARSSYPDVYRRVVVNGRNTDGSEKLCLDHNEIEVYPGP